MAKLKNCFTVANGATSSLPPIFMSSRPPRCTDSAPRTGNLNCNCPRIRKNFASLRALQSWFRMEKRKTINFSGFVTAILARSCTVAHPGVRKSRASRFLRANGSSRNFHATASERVCSAENRSRPDGHSDRTRRRGQTDLEGNQRARSQEPSSVARGVVPIAREN